MAKPAVGIALACLMFAGCTTPTAQVPEVDGDELRREAAVQELLARNRHGRATAIRENDLVSQELAWMARLTAVGWKMLRGAAPLCAGRQATGTGMVLATVYDIPEELRKLYHGRFGHYERAFVMAAPSGTPAGEAGLQVGDWVTAVDGQTIADGREAARQITALLGTRPDQPTALTVIRHGQALALSITPRPACANRLTLGRYREANASADGDEIMVTAGLLDLLPDDDHLATVIGHELAHNLRNHIRAKVENGRAAASVGSFLNLLTGARTLDKHWEEVGERVYSQGFEAEADYVGLYLAAIAGFDIRKAPTVWRLMATANPASIGHASTHPTSPARSVMLEETVREIEAKRAQGLPLEPENRKGGWFSR